MITPEEYRKRAKELGYTDKEIEENIKDYHEFGGKIDLEDFLTPVKYVED